MAAYTEDDQGNKSSGGLVVVVDDNVINIDVAGYRHPSAELVAMAMESQVLTV